MSDAVAFLNDADRAGEFLAVLERSGALERGEPGLFNMRTLATYYCLMDCEVLRAGFLSFSQMFRGFTGLDPWERLTISGLAHAYVLSKGVYKDVALLAGTPAVFIRQAVVGGRCMLADNAKSVVEGPGTRIADFDAVSLYPSAMARCTLPTGVPAVITAFSEDMAPHYFVEIEVLTVGIRRHFPVLSYRTAGGGRVFTNDPRPEHIVVSRIMLELLKRFHAITYRFVRGYSFATETDALQPVMRHLFDERRRLKAAGSPVQEICKLLMNSCYGKTIMNPITSQWRVKTQEELNEYIRVNSASLITFTQIYDTGAARADGAEAAPCDEAKFFMEVQQAFAKSWSMPQVGCIILDMSKVMGLAEEHGLRMFYTDTDSIHMCADDIERLACLYRAAYGRELLGADMGQFHSDFGKSAAGREWYSTCFIGVGKKAYLDVLEDGAGARSVHMRLKGIPNDVLEKSAEAYGGVEGMYRLLYEGGEVAFDLLSCRPRFDMGANGAYANVQSFVRRVRFRDGEEREVLSGEVLEDCEGILFLDD